jgi:hypothetical protein
VKRAFALSLLMLFAVACRTPVPGVLLDPADPLPELRLSELILSGDQRSALRGTARLALVAPDVRLNRPQRIALERPARLRVEILGLFNQLAAVLVTDGHAYQVYRAGETVLESGAVSADLLWRVARIDLEASEAVDLLLGAPRPDPQFRSAGAWLHEDGALVLERHDASQQLRERLRFTAAGQLEQFERFDATGALVLTARFTDYREVEAEGADAATALFAHEVDLDFRGSMRRLPSASSR